MFSLKDIVPITSEYALCLPTKGDSVLIQVGGSQIRAEVVNTIDEMSVLKLPVEVPTVEVKSPSEGSAMVNDSIVEIQKTTQDGIWKIISEEFNEEGFFFQDGACVGVSSKQIRGVRSEDELSISEKPFLMVIDNVFSITGRGTVATGTIERGKVKVGDEIEIVGIKDIRKTIVIDIEMFYKSLDQGEAGDNVGLLLENDFKRDDIERGMVLVESGSITPHKKFEANVYVLKKEAGGRQISVDAEFNFFIRTADIKGKIIAFTSEDASSVDNVMPGNQIKMTVELNTPVAIEQNLCFAIREDERTIGAGVVSRILDTSKVVEIKLGTDEGLVFEPSQVTISVGDTVKFVNNKFAPHNIVFVGHPELSHYDLLFAPGDFVQSTFTEAGTYEFYCQLHLGAGMVGKIIVE